MDPGVSIPHGFCLFLCLFIFYYFILQTANWLENVSFPIPDTKQKVVQIQLPQANGYSAGLNAG